MLLNEALNLSFHQPEVDFLIPNIDEDLRLYVDPFLFYKSENPEFLAVHATIRKFFDIAISQIKNGKEEIAKRMVVFPEVKETMLGLSKNSHEGRGLGHIRGQIIYKEIVSNKDILKYGIGHLAEMQVLIYGVEFDLVSDMCTNIAKHFFVDYTQRQCLLHDIKMEKGICLTHVFDWQELDWDDIHTDLPLNPHNEQPMLFVPKVVIRRFSEINYKDFWTTIYRYILRDIEISRSIQSIGREPKITWKEIDRKYNFSKKKVVEVIHEDYQLLGKYIRKKESIRLENLKKINLSDIEGTDKEATPIENLISGLKELKVGKVDCRKYESIVVKILTRLFSPMLSDPHRYVQTVDRREVIDITFYNSANHGFWFDIKNKYGNVVIVFELKNMTDLGNEEYFQISARLNEKNGKFGILISRDKDNLDIQRAYRRYNNEGKVILNLTDDDIINMLASIKDGISPMIYLTKIYRKFIEEA